MIWDLYQQQGIHAAQRTAQRASSKAEDAAADPAVLQLPYGSLNQNHRRTRGLWLEHPPVALHPGHWGEYQPLF